VVVEGEHAGHGGVAQLLVRKPHCRLRAPPPPTAAKGEHQGNTRGTPGERQGTHREGPPSHTHPACRLVHIMGVLL